MQSNQQVSEGEWWDKFRKLYQEIQTELSAFQGRGDLSPEMTDRLAVAVNQPLEKPKVIVATARAPGEASKKTKSKTKRQKAAKEPVVAKTTDDPPGTATILIGLVVAVVIAVGLSYWMISGSRKRPTPVTAGAGRARKR